MTQQSCPNCSAVKNVSAHVTGQRFLCSCGIRFEVQRTPKTLTSINSTFISTHPAEAVPCLPGYRLARLIGRGGMGEVFLARRVSTGESVAVKLLSVGGDDHRGRVLRFQKEGEVLSRLNHPQIVKLLERGESGGRHYLVMEYADGPSLRDIINQGRLNPSDAARWLSQILDAISVAHNLKIMHRDLKPENVLSSAGGAVKVADFGLANLPRGDLALTESTVAMGTMHYTAPEQMKSAKNVDTRADIYSLGVITYEMLTGELPLGRFRLPSQKISGLNSKWDAIVCRAMNPVPEQRYSSVLSMRRDVLKANGLPGKTGFFSALLARA